MTTEEEHVSDRPETDWAVHEEPRPPEREERESAREGEEVVPSPTSTVATEPPSQADDRSAPEAESVISPRVASSTPEETPAASPRSPGPGKTPRPATS